MEDETKDGECKHVGYHNPVAQSLFLAGNELWVVCTHNCRVCGKRFTNINPITLPKLDTSGIMIPQLKIKES